MREGKKDLRRKVWTRTKISSLNIRYFVAISRSVTIYAIFGRLRAKKSFFLVKYSVYWARNSKYAPDESFMVIFALAERLPTSATLHPSSVSLSNVSFCVPILGSKNVTCLSDGPALHGFQIRSLTYSFLRGLAAPVI